MRYTAICRRAGDWWAISVPQLKGVHTQAKRLDQVEATVKDAIALFLDVAPGSFDVDVRPDVPATAAQAVAARREARQAEERAEKATAAAVVSLLAAGYTVRDAGALLEISPQRVSQISSAAKGKAFSDEPVASPDVEVVPVKATRSWRPTRTATKSGRAVKSGQTAKRAARSIRRLSA